DRLSVSPRLKPLVEKGLVRDSGRRRGTRLGRKAVGWEGRGGGRRAVNRSTTRANGDSSYHQRCKAKVSGCESQETQGEAMTERFSEMARELRDKECPHSKQKVRGRTYEAIYCDECVAAALRSGDAKARLSGMC